MGLPRGETKLVEAVEAAAPRLKIELTLVPRALWRHGSRAAGISMGGLLMDVVHPVASGNSLMLDLMIPGEKPLRVRAYVLATEGEAPNPMWGRLQFENLRGREHRGLVDFIARLTLPDPK